MSRVLLARRLSLIFGMDVYIFFWGGGLIFVRDFWGFVRNPIGFFSGGGRVDFCPHSSIPVT